MKPGTRGEADTGFIEHLREGSWVGGKYWPPLRAGTGAREVAGERLFERLRFIMRIMEGSKNKGLAWIKVEEGKIERKEAMEVWIVW